jgi:adenylate cyclase
MSLIQVDGDELARRLLPAVGSGEAQVPSLPAQAARLLGRAPASGLIDYRLGGPFDYLPLQQLVDWHRAGELEPLRQRLQDRVLIIGSVLEDTDLHRVPLPLAAWLGDSTLVPGVLVQAQSLRTWLEATPIQPLSPAWAALLAGLLALAAFGLRPHGLGLAAGLTLCLVPVLLAWPALARWAFWLAPGPLALGALTGLIGRAALEGLRAARDSRRLRRRFGRYVSPAVLGSIMRGELDGSTAPLRCRVCVLFADIRDFTTRSEGARAEAIADLLNRYFATVVAEIHAQNGTVDKFMGDGIMAFFGAPAEQAHPSQAALTAARGMLNGVARLNRELEQEGVEPIRIGIGLHAGEAVIGHIGSAERQEYTAIGDTVNIASRVEGLCKTTGCAIVCTQAVFEAAAPEGAESLGEYPIKGHTPIEVYGWR